MTLEGDTDMGIFPYHMVYYWYRKEEFPQLKKVTVRIFATPASRVSLKRYFRQRTKFRLRIDPVWTPAFKMISCIFDPCICLKHKSIS